MPKPTKTAGYLVKIEAFVPAHLGDIAALQMLQKNVQEACDKFPGGAPSATITPTRR